MATPLKLDANAVLTEAEGQLFSLLQERVDKPPQHNGQDMLPVERMRYVTPYAQDMDVETDISHHAPNLFGMDKLKLYSMIDTWVGGRPNSFISMNSTSGVCQTVTDMDTSNGQAFRLQADLHLYKKDKSDG